MTVRDLTILGCSSQQPTRRRNHGGYLFRWNEEGLLFDPGEGTQRQFIFANIAPPTVTRIFVSHFHGDHCLGLGSMLMRLNLDKVTRPIHCYYPAGGKRYFDRLRFGTSYHSTIEVVEHPITGEGLVHEDDHFRIEAYALDHGIENYAYRIQEPAKRKFDKAKLASLRLQGEEIRDFISSGSITTEKGVVTLEEVSWIESGEVLAVVMDTRPCAGAEKAAKSCRLLLCESTYLQEHIKLARKHKHLTAVEAAELAKRVQAKELILTHFSARYLHLEAFAEEARAIFPATKVADDLKNFDWRGAS